MHTDLPITTLFQQLIHMFQAISQDHTTTAIYQIHTIHMYQDPMFTITQAFILLDMILTIHITAIVDYQLKLTIQDIVDSMIVIIHHIDTPTMLIQDLMIMITCTQDLMFMTTPSEAHITAEPIIEVHMNTIMLEIILMSLLQGHTLTMILQLDLYIMIILQLDLTLKYIMIILQQEQYLHIILTIQPTIDHTTTELNRRKFLKNDLNYEEIKKLFL